MLRPFKLSATLVMLMVIAIPQALAGRTDRVEAERMYVAARKLEAQGQPEAARYQYASALAYALQGRDRKTPLSSVKIAGEPLGAIGRRGIRLQVQLIEREQAHPSGKFQVDSLEKELQLMYKRMQAIEPQNPNWFYLDALMVCDKEHHYVKARRMLRRCVKCPGNSPVKTKAQKLLAHIKPVADQQEIWLKKDVAEAKRVWKYVRDHSTYTGSTSSSSSSSSSGSSSNSSIPSYERQARNAESRGDYGAAGRLRSGGGSISDGSRYD